MTMKFSRISALALLLLLPSCGLIQSAARIPGSLLGTVRRTAGVSYEAPEVKPEDQKPTEDGISGQID